MTIPPAAGELYATAMEAVERLFTSVHSLEAHYKTQAGEHAALYRATLQALVGRGAELQASTLARGLAAALGRADADLAGAMLALRSAFDVPIVLKAIQLLDAPRVLRQARRKLADLQASLDARNARLLETADLTRADVDGLTRNEVVSRIDKALGTGVRRHARRFRTIEGMKNMSTPARRKKISQDRKASAVAKARHEAQGKPARGFANWLFRSPAPDKAPAGNKAPASEERARRRKLFHSVRRAAANSKRVAAAYEEMTNMKAKLEEAGVPTNDATMHISLSGACAKRLRRWIASVSRDDLMQHVAMDMPRDNWRAICDLVHARPSDFQLPSFQPWLFGTPGAIPKGHEDCPVMIKYARTAAALKSSAAAEKALLSGLDIPYSLVRRRLPNAHLSSAAVSRMLRHTSLTQLLWFMDDGLDSKDALREIALRLTEGGEQPELPFGKLMERLLTLTKAVRGGGAAEDAAAVLAALQGIAEKQLAALDLCLPKPVLVLGDRSASMQVCVETSAIIGAMLAAATDAVLTFFNSSAMTVPTPSNVADVVRVAQEIRAQSCTSPAAGLVEAYEKKQVYATVLVITDEEENTAAPVVCGKNGGRRGMRFAPLLRRYIDEVSPEAQTVFLSFLRRVENEGAMVADLRAEGIEPMQFKMSSVRPDLTKLDSIFARMGAGTAGARAEVIEASREALRAAIEGEVSKLADRMDTDATLNDGDADSNGNDGALADDAGPWVVV